MLSRSLGLVVILGLSALAAGVDGDASGAAGGDRKARAPSRSPTKRAAARNLQVPERLSEARARLAKTAKEAYSRARKSQKASHYKLARKHLLAVTQDKVLKAAPFGHFYLGVTYKALGMNRKALKALAKAVETGERFYQAHTVLAETQVVAGEVEAAIESFDRALAIAKYLRALRGKFEALIRLGRFREAVKFGKRVLKGLDNPRAEPGPSILGLIFQIEQELKGPGWSKTYEAETRNYLVRSSVSQDFVDRMARRAEAIRKVYSKIFSDITRPKRKYEIVLHPSKAAYHRAGGPESAGGHYSPFFRKLVLYRYPKEKDTILVLQHEAFHQFLHDYLELAPQWFNEGVAEYFAPFELVTGPDGKPSGMRSHVNDWRLGHIRHGIRRDLIPSPESLMLMSREEMYGKDAGLHYAMAWSLVYYMLESKAGYAKVLVRYFRELRKGEGLEAAFEQSFGKIDLRKFEERWREYTLKLGSGTGL